MAAAVFLFDWFAADIVVGTTTVENMVCECCLVSVLCVGVLCWSFVSIRPEERIVLLMILGSLLTDDNE